MIAGRNFNKAYFLGQNEDLKPFKDLSGNMAHYVRRHSNLNNGNRRGKIEPEPEKYLPKVHWHVSNIEFTDEDFEPFHEQVKKRLKDEPIDPSYDRLS